MATGIHEDIAWPGGTDKTIVGWAQWGSHPPTSCHAPSGTSLLWKLYSHGLPPPHYQVVWTERNPQKLLLWIMVTGTLIGPRECPSAWLDGCGQARMVLELWDGKELLPCFIYQCKSSHGIRRINKNAVCKCWCNWRAWSGQEWFWLAWAVAGWLYDWRWAVGLTVFAVVTLGGPNWFSKIPTQVVSIEHIWGILLVFSAPLLNRLYKYLCALALQYPVAFFTLYQFFQFV